MAKIQLLDLSEEIIIKPGHDVHHDLSLIRFNSSDFQNFPDVSVQGFLP